MEAHRTGGWGQVFILAGMLFWWLPVADAQPMGSPAPLNPPDLTALPRQIAPGVYELGLVTIDQDQRSVRFPVSINQRTGVVEYAVVTVAGKTHESVFRTEVVPQHVHLGMLLLGARPSNTNDFSRDGMVPLPGEKISIELSWRNAEREIRRSIEEFVILTNTMLPMSGGPWVYNGSFMDHRSLIAQRDGSIVTIQSDPTALVNNPRPDRTNDDLHHVNTAAMPPPEAPLTLTMRLYKPEIPNQRPPSAVVTNTFDGVVTPITPPMVPASTPQPK